MKNVVITRLALFVTFVAAALGAGGGIIYYLYNLSFWPSFVAAVLALALALVLMKKFGAATEPTPEIRTAKPTLLFVLLIFTYLLSGVCLVLLWRAGTTEAINTPWPLVPKLFWIAFSSLVLSSLVIFLKSKNSTLQSLAAVPLAAVAVSVAALVYRLGYGFDPFIHRAAEQFIVSHGAILPKTPYYAGEYALVAVISKLAHLPVRAVDIWLLPSLTVAALAASLPLMARENKKSGALIAAGLALFPFSLFINTTPFGLACLFAFLCFVFAQMSAAKKATGAAVWLFAAASAVTHPIVGVPAIFFVIIFSFRNRVAKAVGALAAILAVPLMFMVQGAGLTWAPGNIFNLSLPFALPLTRFDALGDLVYAAGALIMILALAGAILAVIKKERGASNNLIAAIGAAAGALVTVAVIDFSYLPTEEQAGYPARLLAVALLMLIPPAASAIADFLDKAQTRPLFALAGAAAVVYLVSSNLYLSYPRSDAYVLGKGWGVGAADYRAVEAIAKDAGSEPYLVLAAEPVSAAALERLGFFKYFKTTAGDVFAYPVPLGGELYKYYLKMIYEETGVKTMEAAMKFTGARRAYFVMNPYWTGFARISAAARASADAEIPTGGTDTVFLFRLK